MYHSNIHPKHQLTASVNVDSASDILYHIFILYVEVISGLVISKFGILSMVVNSVWVLPPLVAMM